MDRHFPASQPRAYVAMLLIVALAAGLRILYWNGPLGSDDLVYLTRATQIAEGVLSSANYNGALRYGFNIPAGAFLYLLGRTEFAANLWPLLCSLAEVATIFLFAHFIWGLRAALCSALLLAFVPLHIAVATRIHADPVLAFFLTLSFVLFHLAEKSNRRSLYFLTGLTMGAVFWTKEIAVVGLFALAIYPLLAERLNMRWLYVIGGGLVMLSGHFLLMYSIAGDPFHLIKVVTGQISQSFLQAGEGEDRAFFYFRYLFLDIRHTWLLAFFAVIGIFLLYRSSAREFGNLDSGRFIVFWCLGVVGILSFLPVSLEPFRFVMKQSNYLTMFLAPLALLAGYALSRLPIVALVVAASLIFPGAFALAGLQQQAYRVFTSNSHAATELAKELPSARFLGSTNNANVANFYALLEGHEQLRGRFGYLARPPAEWGYPPGSDAPAVYVVLDHQTLGWGSAALTLPSALPCWTEPFLLRPQQDGFGLSMTRLLIAMTKHVPGSYGAIAADSLQALSQPLPATVYKVAGSDPWCGGLP